MSHIHFLVQPTEPIEFHAGVQKNRILCGCSECGRVLFKDGKIVEGTRVVYEEREEIVLCKDCFGERNDLHRHTP